MSALRYPCPRCGGVFPCDKPGNGPPPHDCVRTVVVSASQYQEAARDYLGWCTLCEDFTRETTEPDAERYDCPECRGNTVMGAELALISGQIRLVDDLE